MLGTGGTIASSGGAGTGAVAERSAADLIAGLPVEHEVETRDIMTVGSYRLTLGDMRCIVETAALAAEEPGVAGVVVTHGTDTVEETAYLAALGVRSAAPIVFTGAQFAADQVAPDGERNLSDAICFAASPELRGAGVGIAFGGALRSARGARKAHSTDPSPFRGGVLLARRVGADVSVLATARPEPETLPLDGRFDRTIVDMVMSYPGADTALFDAAVDRAQGVVLVGTGVGNAAPGFVESVARASRRGVPVVLASRVFDGPVTPVYGNGGGVDLVRAGAVAAGQLSPPQARILAAALIAGDAAGPAFSARFAAHAA